jgi:GGDEF domain-containing protein
VLVMNHGRAPLGELVALLTAAGYAVQVGETLAQSHRLAAASRPDVVLLHPLVLCEGSVELEFAESLQTPDDPVPVIVLVPDHAALAEVRRLALPIRDFVRMPARADECASRIGLALETRANVRDLHGRASMLERQVSIDFKTGLTSERQMRTLIEREWKRAQRHQNPLSLLLIDIDDFKGVNDATDYAFGDEVLRRVADGLKGTVRETDFAARFGRGGGRPDVRVADAAAAGYRDITNGLGVGQRFCGAVETHRLQVLGQPGVHADRMLRKPFAECLAHAVDDVCLAFFVMRCDGLHGFQHHDVLVTVAVAGSKAGGLHPAVFLRKMRHRMVQKGLVQRQLVGLWRGQ